MTSSVSSSPNPETLTDGLPDGPRQLAMTVIVCGLLMCVLDGTMLNLALPQVARDWKVDPAQTLWVVNANQIAALVMLLPLAALGDRLGYKRVYLGGMALFGLASVASLLAPSLPWLIGARALQGLGAAGVMSVNAALVRLIYPRSQLGQGMALNSMMVALASVTGPALAAGVLSFGSWRWLFAFHLPLALWVIWLARKCLPNPPLAESEERLSRLDVLLNIGMFGALFLGLDRLTHYQAGSSWLPGLSWLLLAAVCGCCYVRRQRGLAQPMLPLDLLKIPVFALSMCASVGAFCGQTMAFLALPFLLIEAHGLSTAHAGLLISAWPIALAVSAPWVGRMIGRFPASTLGMLGMGLFAAGLFALAWMPQATADWDMVWRLALCGIGYAMFQSPNNHTIVTTAPVERSGAASGMLGTARHVGQAIGAILLAGAFVLWPSGQAEHYALIVAGGSALLAGLFSGLRRR